MKLFLMILVIFTGLACTRLQTINLKPHNYSQSPNKIIWIQLAGFTDQHLPLLRFDNPDMDYRTQFETFDCIGKMWNFNLFELRPQAGTSFLSQINGSKNIKNICEDFTKLPVWNFLSEEGYNTTILENGASASETLERILTCGESVKYGMKNIQYVRMGPEQKNGVTSFHFQDPQNITPGLYYDKSCQKGICYSSFFNNAKKLISSFGSGNTRHFYLLREFSYQKSLKKKDISQTKEILQDIEKLLAWVDSLKRDDILILVSGAEGIELDFPKEGKEWAEYEKTSKNLNIRNATLLSSIFAKGPMSENFCG